MQVEELPTPSALVDLDRLEANTARMAASIQRLGAALRPHVKTHKTVEAARFQVRGHFGGITVSTLAEARRFAAAGFKDITYAVPISIHRLPEAVELTRTLDVMNLLLDHPATFAALEAAARSQGVTLRALLKVDCGYHRAGVDPGREESVALALRMARSRHVHFAGILTHAGHSYHCSKPEEILEVAETERRVMARFAETLRDAGAGPETVSVGSTPTMSLASSLDGVTEARPGNYVFYDRFQSAIGACRDEDVAFSVLVTVLGQYRDRNELLVDAGALALSKDEGPSHLDPGCGFGSVLSADGSERFPSLVVHSLSQEHGKIRGREAIDFDAFAVGTKLRIVPNHSCLSAALFDHYEVLRGTEVVDQWHPVRGW